MKLLTEKAQVKYAIAKQEAIDPSDRSGVLEKLKALPDTATAEDVQAVVGHGRWVRPARCDECDTVSYLAIEVGEEEDYESRTAVLCFSCVKKAYFMLIDSQRTEKESSVAGTEKDGDAWVFSDQPTAAGWYAISYCWEAQEGMFPDAGEWDGERWLSKLPIVCYAGPFENSETAKTWAVAHDLEA